MGMLREGLAEVNTPKPSYTSTYNKLYYQYHWATTTSGAAGVPKILAQKKTLEPDACRKGWGSSYIHCLYVSVL